ncbi:MAG: signal peptidase I [Planctomycetota bacterium]|nr:signal peptidase I [Planctomycetota bacterium]
MSQSQPESQPPAQVFRETIESLAVAFILALLFKSFVADAFIIPTGSMAPTLMGAHKDVQCEHCGYQYQSGASEEFDSSTGARKEVAVVETICPLCRNRETMDTEKNSNHVTFSGDRILVSKMTYALSDPKRWQVIVFKFIEQAKLNYIKRCVGLPGETLKIWHGDIYVKNPKDPSGVSTYESADGFRIARKPPSVVGATLQAIADTNHLSPAVGEGRIADSWQDTSQGSVPKWQTQIDATPENRASKYLWGAAVSDVPEGSTAMLRFTHRLGEPTRSRPSSNVENSAESRTGDFRFITDFTAYNHKTFRTPNGRSDMIETDGAHWVGDLAGQWQISTSKGTQSLELLLVEGGVEMLCQIDLSTGKATARAVHEGKSISVFESAQGFAPTLEAQTPVRSGSTHRIRYANVDDSLRLWIDGKSIPWGIDGGYSIQAAVPGYRHLPIYNPENPLDAAPVGIGIQGGSGKILQAQVFRDIFYTATTSGGSASSRYDESINVRNSKDPYRLALGTSQANWSSDGLTYQLGPEDYFPMGDNTQASSDARMWNVRQEAGQPGRLMIGRAVMVFWPHYWNYGRIRFIPNFQRMGLIR